MTMNLDIRLLEPEDPEPISAAFTEIGWEKPASQYERYLKEQASGKRTVLVATLDGTFAGYLTINWQPKYVTFREAGIPELEDFNVLPKYRRRRIGTALMDEAEHRVAAAGFQEVGIGVAMDPDYGAAQRMYVLRGYVPDGRGLSHGNNQFTEWGLQVTVNDDLALHFTKELRVEEG